MQKLTLKNKLNILLIIGLFAVCVAMLAAACILPRLAYADGNNAASAEASQAIPLILDVNGRGANYDDNLTDGSYNTGETSLTAHNSYNLRYRIITSTAAVDGFKALNQSVADSITGSSSSYSFIASTVKNRSSKIRVSVSTNSRNLYVEALKIVGSDNPAQFSVEMQNASGTERFTVYFRVTVTDTLAQRGSNSGLNISTANPNLMLGSTLNGELAEVDGWTEGTHPAVIDNIENNSEVTIDLGDLLINRALYYNANVTSGQEDTNYSTPLMQGSTGRFWPIRSVSNFEIVSVAMANSLTTIRPTYFNPTSDAHFPARATFNLNISQTDINSYRGPTNNYPTTGDHTTQFWTDVHRMNVTIRLVGGSDTYTIVVPVKFLQGDNPTIKNIDTSYLSLNVKSNYAKDISTGKYVNSVTLDNVDDNSVDKDAGFNTVIIRPTDLIGYSFPANEAAGNDGKLRFWIQSDDPETGNPSMHPSANAGYSIEIPEGDDQTRPERLIVKITKNGNYNIKFVVVYFDSSNEYKDKPVTVSFKGYGDYSITIPDIEGKRAVDYDTKNDLVFAELDRDGFQMIGATWADEESKNNLSVSFNKTNNTLTLTPNLENVSGKVNAKLRLEFINSMSQKVVVETETFSIDVTRGSFWARFQDWEGGLIIAAAVLVGLVLILFIIWLFIRAISKRKEDENATQAPISSYIVKLNATIAATQAQQRMSQMAITQANSQMLLGANGAPALDPNTLQLATGSGAALSSPASLSQPGMFSQPGTVSQPGGTTTEVGEDMNALIAKYITDDELLERIYTEKYEPKGMVRRTFFKSKDLQARELEKEKNRIIARYKTPMPMDEAIMSETQTGSAPDTSSVPDEVAEDAPPFGIFTLDFEPDAPLYVAPANEEDDFDDVNASPEEIKLRELEKKAAILEKELEELRVRLGKVQPEYDKNKSLEQELREKIEKGEADDEKFKKEIEELEFKLASAKSKEKDKITRDIKIKEEQMARNTDNLGKNRADLESLLGFGGQLSDILNKLNGLQTQKTDEQGAVAKDLDKAKADYDAYKARLEQVRARQALEAKVDELTPLLVAVNNTDYELRDIQASTERMEKEREELKSEVATVKTQILSANDFDVINDLNSRISDINARLSDIEKDITKSTKRKSELNLDMKAQRRKANDFVEKNEIPLESVISAEDAVIGDIELGLLRIERETSKAEAEQAVAKAQAVYDDLAASSADVTMVAMEVAANIKDIEDEIADTQRELDEINAQMEEAGDDEKLMLMVDQGDKSDKIDELKEQLKAANVEGTKRKMEAQAEYDEQLEAAHVALDEANEEFKEACARCDALENTNPLDLITSGSGVISRDQKIIEAENLKKQLERTKNEVEQARLAAEQAQAQAEQARLDAENATNEARAEAERKAQEAAEAAEAARLEAEERVRNEMEAAERVRQEAAEAAELARKEAEEAVEQARKEAEEKAELARKEAEEKAEQARLEAEEKARQEAEEAAERQRAEAEAAEAARLEAEEKARQEAEEQERIRKEQEEAIRAEAEEAKRKAQEEIEEMRRKSEEEAEAKRQEEEAKRKEEEERQKAEAERNEAIARKVAARKEKIINFRDRMKDIKNDDDAKNLREQLYSVQLTFDEDERGSTELMDFYNKTMDDIQHAGEVATLKAENAKKPKRIVRKVTERVNRIPKRKAGSNGKRRPSSGKARPASRSGARPASRSGARPASRSGARPGSRPGSRPSRPR